ncbi:actin cytoskeleton-regulatory complex protein pan1-like [Penaeus japonicus]|uniref:actin cytoskeleton-regulatory complex protein pan1-like n=1 Tax=Penaeus japonicus TaxID=27405 RepID=UPI001C713CF3|nr:actin cytoskeleton-regulatory complex protein pan1-like [Penaeus japonicus]
MRWRQCLCLLSVFAVVSLTEGSEDVRQQPQIRVEKTVTFSKSSSTSSSSSHAKDGNTRTHRPAEGDDELTRSDTQTLLRHVDPFLRYPSQLPLPFTSSYSATPVPLGRHRAVVGTSTPPPGSGGRSLPPRSSNGGPLAPAALQTRRRSKLGRRKAFRRTQSGEEALIMRNAKKPNKARSGRTNGNGEKEEAGRDKFFPNSEFEMSQKEISSRDTEDETGSQAKNDTLMKPNAKAVIIAQMRKFISNKNTNQNQLRPTPVVQISYLGARTGSRPLVSPPSQPTFRPLVDKKAHPTETSAVTARKNNLTIPTKDMKMVLMVKADVAVASTTTPSPPAEAMSETASPSTPLLRITTPAPLVRIARKKHASKVFQPANFLNVDLYHEPLYSMHGPPYDHYKLSTHISPGGSFPSTYHQDNAYYLSGFYPSSYMPHLSSYSGLDYQHPPYFSHYDFPKKQKSTLPPYFSEESPHPLAPSHSYSPSPHSYSPSSQPSYSPPPPPPPHTSPPPQSSYIPSPPPHSYSSPATKPHKHLPVYKPVLRKKTARGRTLGKSYDYSISVSSTTPVPVAKKVHHEPKPQRKPVSSGSQGSSQGNISGGKPGVDYPAYARIPYTSFTCKHTRPSGIYADVEAGCQVWHVCETDGRQHSFLCPNGTIFSQHLLTCDWWYNVQCSDTEKFYGKIPTVDVYKNGYNDIQKNEDKIIKKHSHTIQPKPGHTPKPPASYPYPSKPAISLTQARGRPTAVPRTATRPPGSSSPSHFVEFEPYYHNSYPMFQLRKRHLNNK